MQGRKGLTPQLFLGKFINFFNMKKINSRRMSQANKHVLVSSLSYNLKKYLRFIVKKTNVITQVLTLEQGKLTVFTKQPFDDFKRLDYKYVIFLDSSFT